MITRATSFKTEDGECFSSLREAQENALVLLVAEVVSREAKTDNDEAEIQLAEAICKRLVGRIEETLDILTTTETSLAKARAINGGRKPRREPRDSPRAEGAPSPRPEKGVDEETSNVPSQEVS